VALCAQIDLTKFFFAGMGSRNDFSIKLLRASQQVHNSFCDQSHFPHHSF
jgi:hypothetical protein